MTETFSYPNNFIRYLGTGGARFAMIHQSRATGGIWFSYGGLNGVIDPGPGSLVHICAAYPQLNPEEISALILTHRHIDHSTDINVLTEAMTQGGKQKRGTIVATHDAAFAKDPVLLAYSAAKAEYLYEMQDGKKIKLWNGVTLEPVKHLHHGVDCFGLIFEKRGFPTWGIISDTRPLETLPARYAKCKFISLNATMLIKRPQIDHFSLPDTAELLEELHPKLMAITHIGRLIIERHPDRLVSKLSTGKTRVVAACDGMVVDLDSLKLYVPPVKRVRKVKYKELADI